MSVESNLVLKTTLEKPTGTGYTDVIKDLRTIEHLLDEISKKSNITVTVTYTTVGTPPVPPVPPGPTPPNPNPNPGPGPGPGPGGRGGSGGVPASTLTPYPVTINPPPFPNQSLVQIGGKTTTNFHEDENGVLMAVQQHQKTFLDTQRNIVHTVEQTINAEGEITKTVEASVNMEEKRIQAAQRALVLDREKLAINKALVQNELAYLQAQGYTHAEPGRRQTVALNPNLPHDRDEYNKYKLGRVNPNDPNQIEYKLLNELTGTTKDDYSKNRPELHRAAKIDKANTGNLELKGVEDNLLSKGFVVRAERLERSLDGVMYKAKEFAKITGNAFIGYEVDVRKVNTATGKFTQEILRGNEAMRYLGDSSVRAIAKVSQWITATSVVFGTIAALRHASQVIVELEHNSAMLARIGQRLGVTDAERYANAEKLTRQLERQAAVYGVNAGEAQKAAAIFLRSGQSQEQTLRSVTAAMIASRLSEVDLEESAKLLSAAQSQFKLGADDLAPTLDTLITLTNRYRVNFNDLLQAISRTGGVVEDEGTSLTELAAVTATVSQATGRSGSEIGNAIKTIQSRIVSEEVSANILAKTGVGLRDNAGEAKSLTRVLGELQIAFAGMSAAQRDELTVSIGGVRQRNILIAAVNNSVDAVIAASAALQNSDSATALAARSAGTLEAAMKRLVAVFNELIMSTGGPLVNILKSIMFALEKAMEIVSGGGLLSKLAGLSVILAAVTFTAKVFKVNLNEATVALVSNAAAFLYDAACAVVSTVATEGAAAAMKGMALSLGAAVFGFIKANLAAIILTATIAILAYVVSQYSEERAKANALDAEAANTAARASSEAKKRVESIELLTDALSEQISVLNDLEGKEDDASKKQREIAIGNVKKLTPALESQGIPLPGNFDPSNKADRQLLLDQATAKVVEQKRQELIQLNKQRGELQGKRDAEITDLQEREEILKREHVNPIEGARQAGRHFTDKFALFPESRLKNVRKELEQYQGSAGGLPADEAAIKIRELDKQIKEAQKEYQIRINVTIRDNEAMGKLVRLMRTEEDFKQQSERLAIGGERFDVKPLEQMQTEYQRLTKRANEYGDQMAILLKDNAIDEKNKNWIELNKLLTEAANRAAKLAAEMEKVKSAQRVESYREWMQGQGRMLAGRETAMLRRQRGLAAFNPESGTSSSFDDMADKMLTRNRLLREAEDLSLTAEHGGTPEKKIAARQETQEKLNELSKVELEIATALEIKEAEIAVARKRSADEAARALGTLSEIDKARVLLQADFFAKNPGKKVTLEEQFLNSADNNKILQQFFGGRAETLDQAQARGSFLANGAFGQIKTKEQRDADKAQAEIDAARGGLTADQFAARQQGRSDDAAAQRDRLAGRADINRRGGLGMDAQPNIDLHMNTSAIDFAPVFDRMNQIVNVEMVRLRDDFAAKLQKLEDNMRQTKDRPAIAPPAQF